MFIDDVKNRRSVRTFDDKGVSNEVIDDLKEYAGSIVNPYNIPVEFVFLKRMSMDYQAQFYLVKRNISPLK